MKARLQEYRRKMQRYNEFELAYNKKLDYITKLKQYFALVEFGFKTIQKEKIKELQEEKLTHLITCQKRLSNVKRNLSI